MNDQNHSTLLLIPIGLMGGWIYGVYSSLSKLDRLFFSFGLILLAVIGGQVSFYLFSPWTQVLHLNPHNACSHQ